jgi:predicted nucleic-acid-binding Zn-ribbon protein
MEYIVASSVALVLMSIVYFLSEPCKQCGSRFMKHTSSRFDYGLLGPAGRKHARTCRKCGYSEKTTEWISSWKERGRFDEWQPAQQMEEDK